MRAARRLFVWGGLATALLGIVGAIYGVGLGSLNMMACNNDFTIRASNFYCSFPSVLIYASMTLFVTGIIALLVGVTRR